MILIPDPNFFCSVILIPAASMTLDLILITQFTDLNITIPDPSRITSSYIDPSAMISDPG